MSRAYSDIAFTPAVRAMQSRMGSRANYALLDHTDERNDRLGPREAEFITARDSFYQATVSETGWPYVQFRGGPVGFLKVLDEKTLGYADFRGNVQYISVGNVANNDPPEGDSYEIAVQREDNGSGGSLAAHRDYHLGMTLHCDMPGNDFELHTDNRPAVLIAGGIGITPIHSMAHTLARQGRSVTLHYAARSRSEAALAQPLHAALGDAMTLYLGDSGEKLDVRLVISRAPAGSVFYVCGPSSLIEAVRMAARDGGIAEGRVRFERFAAAPVQATDRPIRVTLRRSGKIVDVGASQSVLDALQAAGVDAPASCRSGTCGTCAVKVLAGDPDHRDTALSAVEREQAGLMCICVSRAKSSTLSLDL